MGRLIVYDGDCALCIRGVRSLVRLKLVPEDGVAAWDDLEGDDAQRTWDAGFRNEMAVLDGETGEIRSGARGLMWVLRDSWLAPVAFLLDLPGLRGLTALGYRTIAYNRRVLAPPPVRGFVCACDPDERRGYQWTLIVALALACSGVAAAFGALSARHLGVADGREGALVWLLACGLGWLPPALASLRLEPSLRMKYLGSLAVTAFAGALALVPALLAMRWLAPPTFVVVVALSMAAGFAWMWRAFHRRLDLLGLGRGWIRLWTVSMLGAMLGTLGTVGYLFTRP